ncbi:PREDICTED: pentatricopeptide repeat-containing protein At4g02750-like [Tarenaya hassleriana]|uniref:pentatricopeptide repeat-containing protein At4g02750-like n=1 Tax=Tarenaya hassleriana TaxID=28532 RepID=UPI00053C579F|nr:PREDICTED: pentatricopeptide repeat-containing protein At4g02750-like [Tarenaya hassleriana]XP_010542919.1 PREDICTED: pentatricopeptide repeat-containing protein At4g02750-like [Tarenaya hassleriana]
MNRSLVQLLDKIQCLKSLKSLNALLIIDGSICSSDIILNKLIRIYSRFGATDDARKLFDGIPDPNPFLWTALIHGYVENRQYLEAFHLFRRMLMDSVAPLNFTVASVLKALAREGRVENGEALCGFLWKTGLGLDLVVQNALLDAFMRFGKVDTARRLFDEMDEKDTVSWNSMIAGFGNNGRIDIARELFDAMPEKNVISWTSLISGYIKDGKMLEASGLFHRMPKRDAASFNVVISGYIDAGDMVAVRKIFDSMPVPDSGSWNLMVSGFCRAGNIDAAKEFFEKMPNRTVASWSIMIDGYMKAGDVDTARSLFDQMPQKNLVSWSIMIEGYARNGKPGEALKLYAQFKEKGIKPDETFILGVISACSQLGIISKAESMVLEFLGPSAFSNLQIVTSLIDMYAKCGSVEKARQLFSMVHKKDLLCYTTMIQALANHGLCREAISMFDEMVKAKIAPDGVSFLGVLTACNHGGLVDEGREYFKQMKDECRIQPSGKHYACIVDLLGRAGLLQEAYDMICSMPMVPHAVVWGALLAACRVCGNVELAEIAAAELFKIEPENSGNYILLSNIYAAKGRWDGVAKMRTMIKEHRVKKSRGSSWIELGGRIHEFVMGDTSHVDTEGLCTILALLGNDMKFLWDTDGIKKGEFFSFS